MDEHIEQLYEILTTLADAGVTLKIPKRHLFQREVEYLGQIFKPGRLEIDRTKVESLRQAQPPKNKTQFSSFLGLFNVYRRFIDELTRMAPHPLKNC